MLLQFFQGNCGPFERPDYVLFEVRALSTVHAGCLVHEVIQFSAVLVFRFLLRELCGPYIPDGIVSDDLENSRELVAGPGPR